MPDEYKKAYLTLFNAVTDALGALEAKNYGQAQALLKRGQVRAEEAFILSGETMQDPADVIQ